MDHANERGTDKPKRLFRPIVKLCVAGLVIASLLPVTLGMTALRDSVLKAIVNSDKLPLRSSGASLGFFSPISVTELRVESIDEDNKDSFQKISADRSWPGILFSKPDLGSFRFEQPKVDITVRPQKPRDKSPEDSKSPRPTTPLLPNLTAHIVDATVIVRTLPNEPPLVDLTGLNAEVRLERRSSLSILIV